MLLATDQPTPPTPDQIAAEIAELKALKPRIRQYTLFNDDNPPVPVAPGDNHAAIDAQVALLEDSDPEEAINDYDIENDEHIYFAASEALEWLRGERDEPPSVDWADLTPALAPERSAGASALATQE